MVVWLFTTVTKINVAARRIGSTAPTTDIFNAKILEDHISDEMDSIKLSKRGTEDEREYCVGRSEMARPPFYEIFTATG